MLHYEINCHMIVSSVPWMDDGTDGWMDGKLHKEQPPRPLLYVMDIILKWCQNISIYKIKKKKKTILIFFVVCKFVMACHYKFVICDLTIYIYIYSFFFFSQHVNLS